MKRSARAVPVHLPGAPGGRKVAVIAGPAARERVLRVASEMAGEDLTVLLLLTPGPGAGGAEPEATDLIDALGDQVRVRTVVDHATLVDALSRLGQLQMIVDLLESSALPRGAPDHPHLFEHLFFHLAPRGTYVLDRRQSEEGPAPGEMKAWKELRAGHAAGLARPAVGRRREMLFRHLKKLRVTRELVVARKRGRHYLKLQLDQLDLLAEREPQIEVAVLDSRPGGAFDVRSRISSYGQPPDDETWPDRISYPDVSVRRYDGAVVSATHLLLTAGDTMLPDSFRWPLSLPLDHPKTVPATTDLCRITEPMAPRESLRGSYYYLDCLFPGHFGHLTTEVLSRLWGWDVAKREDPDLKAFFHVRPSKGFDGTLERALYTAYGIPHDDLVTAERPVTLESVVSATPLWQNKAPHYAHPDIRETWARLSHGLLQGTSPQSHDKLFVSRGADLEHRRGCRNQAEVESAFAARGFHVVYPEDLPLSQQVAMFAGARVVAGFGGSAMFNLMHTRRLEHVIVMSHDGYLARNEQLYASLLGAQLDYFWSPADVRPAPGVKWQRLVRSPWAFDFDRLGADLDRVLAAS